MRSTVALKIAPAMPSGTFPAFAEGDAIGGRTGGAPSALSVFNSSVGVGSGAGDFFVFGVGDGDGCVSASLRLSVSFSSVTLPLSSSSSLPTSFEEVKPTSLSAAKTDAPLTVIKVPPPEIHCFNAVTPLAPKAPKYLPAEPFGIINTL